MTDRQPPEFVKVDPAAVEADLVARYEAATGKTLYPAQVERLFINQIAYAHGLAQTNIQSTGEKVLVRFSSGIILDYLGDLVGTPRLLAKAAQCKIRFSKKEETGADFIVPAGTRVATVDGRTVFEIEGEARVTSMPAIVDAFCTVEGVSGNGWMPGQVSVLEGDLPVVAVNVTESTGGAGDEADDRYKERIIAAPEAYTNAGSYGAYRHHAMSSHQSIVDVVVHGPNEGEKPGHVAIYPLVETGLPSEYLQAVVLAALSSERVRPLCDTVLVRQPEIENYEIRARLTFYETADRTETAARAREALDAYIAARQRELGADLVPEQIAAVLQVSGVYRVQMLAPALRVLASHQWGYCSAITLIDGGTAHG